MSDNKCTSGCKTQDHKSWGECVGAKTLELSPHVNGEYGSRQKKWDGELNAYESAVRQGVQPVGTKLHQTQKALKEAENGSN